MNESVPPVEVFIHEVEEVPDEKNGCENQSNGSNEDYTAFEWETKAVGVVFGEFVSTYTITAAAFFQNWFSIRVILTSGGLTLWFLACWLLALWLFRNRLFSFGFAFTSFEE